MKKLPQVIIVLALGAVTVLSAQTTTTTPTDGQRGPRRGGPGGPGRGGHPIVRAIDADKNGELSATELASAPAAIRALDANSDGVVSKEELHPVRPAGAPQRPADAPTSTTAPTRKEGPAGARPVDPVMLALDANSDGALSAAEITNAGTSLAALDLNKDGKLTHDELRPLPPAN